MAKKKVVKEELDTKVEKVALEVKNEPIKEDVVNTYGLEKDKVYKFLSNGKSPYLKNGEEVYINGRMAILFLDRGYGKVLND